MLSTRVTVLSVLPQVKSSSSRNRRPHITLTERCLYFNGRINKLSWAFMTRWEVLKTTYITSGLCFVPTQRKTLCSDSPLFLDFEVSFVGVVTWSDNLSLMRLQPTRHQEGFNLTNDPTKPQNLSIELEIHSSFF